MERERETERNILNGTSTQQYDRKPIKEETDKDWAMEMHEKIERRLWVARFGPVLDRHTDLKARKKPAHVDASSEQPR